VTADAEGPVSGTVFKVERGAAGEKIAYVRIFSGTVRTRDRLRFGRETEDKVTAITVFDRGSATQRAAVSAGEIGKLWGLAEVQIGDSIGGLQTAATHQFAPPTLETVVVPRDPADRHRLRVALAQLAEQDPFINVRQDDTRREISVSLYGEVQKEVIEATLATDFGVEVTFRETTTIHVERPVGTGAALESLHAESNPFLATVGLRIEPAPADSGIDFRLDVRTRSVPLYVYKTVQSFTEIMAQTVRRTLEEGLFGWRVTDCTVTMTDSGYASPGSTAADFRKLTPLVLMSALEQAGTQVCEPIVRVSLELPTDAMGSVLSVLAGLGAVVQVPSLRGKLPTIETVLPAARVRDLQRRLPALTGGEGVLETAFAGYEPVGGEAPTRRRTAPNALNREEYMLHIARRAVSGTSSLRESTR
jgi:ribosomal protection tetracycline resistance protein